MLSLKYFSTNKLAIGAAQIEPNPAFSTTTATAINLSDLFEGIFEETQTEPAQASELERVDPNLMDRTDVQKIKPTIVADYWF